MTREEAIKVFTELNYAYKADEYGDYFYDHGDEVCQAASVAIAALREREERSKGCEYCRCVESIYQHTKTTKISIQAHGKARALLVESNPCPPSADCCKRSVPDRSVFLIRFCPECGRRLEEV